MVQIINQILHLFDSLKTLCKQYNLQNIPQRISMAQFQDALASTSEEPNRIEDLIGQYINMCEELRFRIFEYQELQGQYKKLEEVLQKNETEIRRHIGVEQELKLYIDTIKSLYDESEQKRTDLLKSSKKIIRQLKADKQTLYVKLKKYEDNHKVWSVKKEESKMESGDKSNAKQKNQKRIKENLKTQYDTNYERSEDKLDNSFIKIEHNAIKNLKSSDQKVKKLNRAKNTISFKAELTDRGLLYAHKKRLLDLRKKQNQLLMPSNSSHKRKQGHDQTSNKKAPEKMLRSNQQHVGKAMALKSNSRSNKKAHRSLFQLQSFYLDQEGEDSEAQSFDRLDKPNSFYLSPDLIRKKEQQF